MKKLLLIGFMLLGGVIKVQAPLSVFGRKKNRVASFTPVAPAAPAARLTFDQLPPEVQEKVRDMLRPKSPGTLVNEAVETSYERRRTAPPWHATLPKDKDKALRFFLPGQGVPLSQRPSRSSSPLPSPPQSPVLHPEAPELIIRTPQAGMEVEGSGKPRRKASKTPPRTPPRTPSPQRPWNKYF